jgi:SAM-dependent methyltransferase
MAYSEESYESYLVPALFGPWAARLLQFANPQPGERVLDLACGTGIVARRMVSQLGSSGSLTALDLNRNMLRLGRAAAGQASASIGWVQSRAERLGFFDSCFNLVVCQFGLMFFADRQAALGELRRVLRPGGRLVLSVWQGLERHPFFQTLHAASRRRIGTSGVEAAFSLGDAGELRHYLAEAGLIQIEIEPVSLTVHIPQPQEFLAWEVDVNPAAIPALRHLDPQAQQAILADIRQEMQAPLRQLMQGDHVVIQLHAHIARTRR